VSKGKRALRYAKPEDMPAGMRAALEAQQSARAAVEQAFGVPAPLMIESPPCKNFAVLSASVQEYQKVPKYLQTASAVPKKGKYGAHAVVVDGIRFDSKREARYYEALKLRVAAGEVLFFLRQVPFHLPGGTKLVVDFEIHEADGRVRYVDTKGVQTKEFRIKKREVEHHYPVEIELA